MIDPDTGLKYRLEMPFLMVISLGCFALYAVFGTAFGVLWLVGSGRANWAEISPLVPPFFLRLLFVQAVASGLLGVGAAVITYAMWHERPWSRDLILVWSIGGLAIAVVAGWVSSANAIGTVAAGLLPLVHLVFCVWYFYRKPNVRAYYQVLEQRQSSAQPVRAK